jgi:hypothetical protein
MGPMSRRTSSSTLPIRGTGSDKPGSTLWANLSPSIRRCNAVVPVSGGETFASHFLAPVRWSWILAGTPWAQSPGGVSSFEFKVQRGLRGATARGTGLVRTARGGDRTRTGLSARRILSPVRPPVPPPVPIRQLSPAPLDGVSLRHGAPGNSWIRSCPLSDAVEGPANLSIPAVSLTGGRSRFLPTRIDPALVQQGAEPCDRSAQGPIERGVGRVADNRS